MTLNDLEPPKGGFVEFFGCSVNFKRVTPLISGYFTDIASSSMETVADRHRRPAYNNKH